MGYYESFRLQFYTKDVKEGTNDLPKHKIFTYETLSNESFKISKLGYTCQLFTEWLEKRDVRLGELFLFSLSICTKYFGQGTKLVFYKVPYILYFYKVQN